MRTSVIVPAYRAEGTLPRVLEALRPQVTSAEREVVLVDSTGAETAARLREEWPWVIVVGLSERTLPGRARNLGVEIARGELLAFLDADAVPAPDWLDELERSLTDCDAVGGAVVNGTPADPWGSAGYLLEFLDWSPNRTKALRHAASANLLVRRSVFERKGGFPEGLWPGEDTVFTFGLGAAGRLAFAPRARVVHLNRTGRSAVLHHQRRLGVAYVAVCAQVPFPGGWLGRPRLAALAVLGRTYSLLRQCRGRPEVAWALMRDPLRVAAALVAWGIGVAGAENGTS